ncbi:MAG: glycoside hydrolase family 13 protein [Cyanobacteriota bacterium]|nr:glycoside hydrolase family 13 protein [Cyanobacteriota bacterium]
MQIQTPEWVKHAVFYQIFPDRFAKGQTSTQTRKGIDKGWYPSTLELWDEPPTPQGYKGGNLWGVIEQLDYIQDLGVTAIYFTPIFQSACNHRYHTHDYYRVDPILGGNEALKVLIDAAHDRNIKVVLDGVFNHASRGFYFFNDILENGPHSPWLHWFKVEGWPLSAYDGSLPANYVGWIGNRALPVFNHDNPEVKEYIMQIGEYWLEFGIDGWRLDVPFEVKTPGFWQEFRDRIKAINPEAYIVGEVWSDCVQWLDGTQFDGVMNYLFTGPTIAFTGGDRVDIDQVKGCDYSAYPAISAVEYGQKMQELLQLYPWEIELTQLNLLDSHDTARLLSIAQGDRASVELATLLLMTFPGAPSIYYGDEVGLPGALDPDSRRSFPTTEKWDTQVLEYHKQLIAIRNQYSALRTGSYEVLFAEGNVYVFARILGDEEIIVAINSGTEAAKVNVSVTKLNSRPSKIVYGSCDFLWQEESTELELNLLPRKGIILVNN